MSIIRLNFCNDSYRAAYFKKGRRPAGMCDLILEEHLLVLLLFHFISEDALMDIAISFSNEFYSGALTFTSMSLHYR